MKEQINWVCVQPDYYRLVRQTKGWWLSCKLAIANMLKKKETAAGKVEIKKSSVPVYDPEEDALYDFNEEVIGEDDLMDLEDLDDIKLDFE